MKIGILTLPLHTNYGGILQAYAFQTTLIRLGHEVQVINRDRSPKQYSTIEVAKHFFKFIISSLLRSKIYPYYNIRKSEQHAYQQYLVKAKHTQGFVDSYIKNLYVTDYRTDINKARFDAIAVGSDQIWSHIHAGQIGGVSNSFLPDLPLNVKRFSYAASFGKDSWEYTAAETIKAKECIHHFCGISVRESSGIALCKDYLDVGAVQHIDPTMLITKEDYVKGISLNDVQPSDGNLLVYLIDSSKEKSAIVDYIENTLSLNRFVVNSKAEDTSDDPVSIEDCIQPPVEKWLRGFMDAEFIVTDSFHACVVSILFHKPFIVIGNIERGLTRFQSLLGKFGISDRLISTLEDVRKQDLFTTIDYDSVERILNEERNRSISYLKEMLS